MSHIFLDPHPSVEELTAFDRGLLRRAEREAIERHIMRCMVCCQRLDSIGDDELITLLRTSANLTSSNVAQNPHGLLIHGLCPIREE